MSNSAMQQLYQQIILDHAKARHGFSPEPLPALADAAGGAGGAADVAADGAADGAGEAAGLRRSESHQVNTTCGDEVTVRVGVRSVGVRPGADTGADGAGDDAVIEEFVWRGDGCSISMASASVLNDTVRGETVGAARAMLDTFREMLRSRGTIEPDEEVLGDAAAFSGVSRYPARVKCAMLPWVALEAALLER